MPAHELAEWVAWEQIHGPILVHERVDFGLARLAWMWGPRDARLEDFMPQWGAAEPGEDEMLMRAQEFAQIPGVKVVRRGDDQ